MKKDRQHKNQRQVSPSIGAIFHSSFGIEGYKKDNGKGQGTVMAIHKWCHEISPYSVANEYICGCLGVAIGLPIPPFALTKFQGQKPPIAFSSLNFNPGGNRLPPVECDILCEKQYRLCVGVIVFDVWIANEDRHNANLAVDKLMDPKELHVFDHDQALFGGCNCRGIERFDKLKDRLGITGSSITGGNEHCLLNYLIDDQFFDEWIQRVKSVGDWTITEACKRLQGRGLTKKEVFGAVEFLLHRQKNLGELIYGQLFTERKIVRRFRDRQMNLFEGIEQ